MAKGSRVSFGGDENVLKLIVVIVANSVNILKAAKLYTLNFMIYKILKIFKFYDL